MGGSSDGGEAAGDTRGRAESLQDGDGVVQNHASPKFKRTVLARDTSALADRNAPMQLALRTNGRVTQPQCGQVEKRENRSDGEGVDEAQPKRPRQHKQRKERLGELIQTGYLRARPQPHASLYEARCRIRGEGQRSERGPHQRRLAKQPCHHGASHDSGGQSAPGLVIAE